MIIEWKSILLVLAIVFVALVVIKILEKKVDLKPEIKRKLFHVSMGITMLAFPHIFSSTWSVGLLGVIALAIMIALKNTKLKDSLGTILYSVNRESLGEIFFVISVFLIFYLSKGDKVLYSIPILILTFADSAAAIIGKNYGKNNLAQSSEDTKSIEGSFIFFVVAFMATLVPLLLWTEVGREETLIISGIVGFNVALIEMISHTGNDNLLIPLTTYALVATHIGLGLTELRTNLIILIVIFVLVTIANRVKAWSKIAVAETFVVGYLTMTLYGAYAIIPPLMVVFTIMRFPKRREIEKKNVYDARILETNIIIPIAICGIVAVTGWQKQFFMVYATSYALHLIINSFVRFKYFIKLSELDSALLAISKGIGFVFIPSLIIQKLIFKEITNMPMLITMVIACGLSAFMIYLKKKDVKIEETSMTNAFMQMRIVLKLTIIVSIMQYLSDMNYIF